MENISTDNLQIFLEKSRTFCGSFKIPLDKLKPEEIPDNPRQFDFKNKAELVRKFNLVNCQKLDPEHYVPALISRADLPQSVRPNRNLFDEPEQFNPPRELICIDGQHRLEAAKEFLAGEDRWWVANLFADDINVPAQNALREHDPGSAKYFDGDIYRQIRIAALDKSNPSEITTARKNKWLARLSPEKRRTVMRIERSPVMCEVRDALDALVPFTGLWPALEIGQLQRLLKIHCPEEEAHYLGQITKTWTPIIGEDPNRLDARTVCILQGRCPFRSLDDREYVETKFQNGEILPAVKSPDLRKRALEHVLSVEHIIPSIYTFLESTKCLESCVPILKSILPTRSKGSLAQAFHALHNGQTKLKEQTSAFTYQLRDLPTGYEVEWLAYRQLWVVLLRHFPYPKKDTAKWKRVGKVNGKRKRDDAGQDVDRARLVRPIFRRQWLRELALLASANGYQQIRQADHDPCSADAIMATEFLLNARPPSFYQIKNDRFRQKVQHICQVLEDIEHVEFQTRIPELTVDHDDCKSDIDDRCGRPQEHSVKRDEENLFLDHIYPQYYRVIPRKYMTSFAWKRDMFHFFFGTLKAEARTQSSEEDPGTDGIVREASHPPEVSKSASIDVEVHDQNPTPRSTPSLEIQESATQLVRPESIHYVRVPAEDDVGEDGLREQEIVISLAEASRLLFDDQVNASNPTFTVLSPTENDNFHRRYVDPYDKHAMIAALPLPSHFWSKDVGNRLKLTDIHTVVKEAESQQIRTVLMVPHHGSNELINRLEHYGNR